jgi:hypothetical protein
VNTYLDDRRLTAQMIGVGAGVLTWWLAGWAVNELYRVQSAGPTLGSPFPLVLSVVLLLTGFLRMIGVLAVAGTTILVLWAVGWLLSIFDAQFGWELVVRANDVLVPAVGAIWLMTGVARGTTREATELSVTTGRPGGD